MAKKRRNRGRQGGRSARAAAVAARPRRVDVVVPDAPGRTEPEPWPHRAIFLAAGLALLLQPVAGLLRMVTVHAPLPVALLLPDPTLMLIAVPVAAPFAQRWSHAPRPLRFLESVSMGAVASLLYLLAAAAIASVIRVPAARSAIGLGVLIPSALAEAVAFLVAAAVYPWVQRHLLMPRRRPPRPPRAPR